MKRVLLILLGFSFVALAALGAFLPVLPTTPFLLLAATCFAKSSKRCHQWLLNNKLFGPIIENWQLNRCIPAKAKILAISSIVFFGSISLYTLQHNTYALMGTSVLLFIGLFVVIHIPTCP
ncbi:YbaN family protein [Thalassomonas sp. M1454]|uniref:YbaN family protein n=1 Tax=Thalassomonas sp. M1454 TaxID=2594477 RepID=UPI001180297C|nr:YbaN family protein [Thalassomonas sp. M1454]TRX53421.1 DUF454 domain-containing protein [Thalassomonas sp. M1454]